MPARELHITNGDSAAGLIRDAGIEGDILPWRDVLHDGPVPADLDRVQLAECRADFLAEPAWLDRSAVLASMRERDAMALSWRGYDRIVIWLEHDLYDQLQLLQILDLYAAEPIPDGLIELICIDRFPGIEPFYGLGQLSPRQLVTLIGCETPVDRSLLDLGQEGWQAFTSPNPNRLLDFANGSLAGLRFMRAALGRYFEEFPDPHTGLGRNQRQILQMVKEGIIAPGQLFREHQRFEEAPYLGDWSFFRIIEGLALGRAPLLEPVNLTEFQRPRGLHPDSDFLAQRLRLTALGEAVLAARTDWMECFEPDYWKGGVQFSGQGPYWRWDGTLRRLLKA